jgi:hypothetical protein
MFVRCLFFVQVLVIVIGFCFLPASFIMFVVRERETSSKHQQVGAVNSCLGTRLRPIVMSVSS